MINLFVNCGWADPHAEQLVSLARISEDGQHRVYAEVSPLPNRPTAFVQAVVYPLLEHGWMSMRAHDLTESLRRFFAQHHDPVVIFDYPDDGKLLRRALQGTRTPSELPIYREALVARESIFPLIERHCRERTEVAKRRHHAGVDADALRWAWCQWQSEGEGRAVEVTNPV